MNTENTRAPAGFRTFESHAFLTVHGNDAERFLNGQLTADVRMATSGRAMPSCCTDAKGRLNAILHVRRMSEPQDSPAFLLDASAELREPLLGRLEKYLISDEVRLADATEAYALVHAVGLPAAASSVLAKHCLLPIAPATRIAPGGSDLIVAPQDVAAVRDLLAHFLPEWSSADAETLRIESAIPAWGRELSETTLPAEAGLDFTSISFDKGCYVGQEVVSRMKSIGHPSRILRGFVVREGRVEPGMTLHPADTQTSGDIARAVGSVASCADGSRVGAQIALGYLRWPGDTPELVARNSEGTFAALLSLHPLPFRT